MAFLVSLPLPTNRSSNRCTSTRRPPRRMIQSTLAAPKSASPNKPEHAHPETAPWMPLPGVVHELLTPEQYDRLCDMAAENAQLLVVDFMASWCRKCIYLLPKLRKLAKANENTYFCAVDVNKVKRLPREFDIKKMPTFVFVREGKEVARFVGGAAPVKIAKQLEDVVGRFVGDGGGSSS